MATAADYRVDGMPRVRVLCALTGELIYEPTHPWLEQVRCHLLKKWTWINKGIYLPTALTLFYLHFEVEHQPIDDLIYCSVCGLFSRGTPILTGEIGVARVVVGGCLWCWFVVSSNCESVSLLVTRLD